MGATALHTNHGRVETSTSQTGAPEPTLAERVFEMSAMTGAVGGTVIGMGLGSTVGPAVIAAGCGVMGIVFGSVLGSAVGRYLILPVCNARTRHQA